MPTSVNLSVNIFFTAQPLAKLQFFKLIKLKILGLKECTISYQTGISSLTGTSHSQRVRREVLPLISLCLALFFFLMGGGWGSRKEEDGRGEREPPSYQKFVIC